MCHALNFVWNRVFQQSSRTSARYRGQGRRCCQENCCAKRPSYGEAHGKKAEFCSQHMQPGMVNVVSKRCGHPGMRNGAWSQFVVGGATIQAARNPRRMGKTAARREFCSQHAKPGMTNIMTKRCGHPGCIKHRTYGKDGSSKAEFCSQHAQQDMSLTRGALSHPGCINQPSFGKDGSKNIEFCSQHSKAGMINLRKAAC
ncbi:unnamed protein product [Ectocarpus sp. CCAP 1310/34]|nr:unnamed protein product [Ectocarpus sp. CCAP 1310/34]